MSTERVDGASICHCCCGKETLADTRNGPEFHRRLLRRISAASKGWSSRSCSVSGPDSCLLQPLCEGLLQLMLHEALQSATSLILEGRSVQRPQGRLQDEKELYSI